MRCQLISLPDPHREQKLIQTLVAIQVISPSLSSLPPSLSQHVRPDVKRNIVEGRSSPNNEKYTTSPNLILQQMAKCDLWPWQISVLVKPSSTIWKSERNRRMRLRGNKMAEAEYKHGIASPDKHLSGQSGKDELNKSKRSTSRQSDRVLTMQPRVNADRFNKDQQSKILGDKQQRVRTQERGVKNHERPIRSEIRMTMSSKKWDETKSRKTTQSLMIIMSKMLWSLVICDADDRTREWVLIRLAIWKANLP